MTTTATPTYTYRAQTDVATKNWHLGAEETGAKCFCGTVLMTPEDRRKFALKVAAAERGFQIDTALDCITCGACKRNREYKYATGLETRPATTTTRRRSNRAPARQAPESPTAAAEARMGEAELAAHTRNRRREHRATMSTAEAAALAEAAAATPEAADAAAPPSRRRGKSRADRAQAKAEADRARREALTADAGTTVAAIEAAIAEATGEPGVTRRTRRADRADALVDSGLATDRADARAQLADMSN
jgi:hypothetical protein